MNIFVSFQYTQEAINELMISLIDMYPLYLQEPKRIKDIIDTFDLKSEDTITLIVEEDHIDKQYRDSYYTYFSQKYSDFKRNCIRLSFFKGKVSDSDFMGDVSLLEKESFIGFIVLRPLNVGNIGNVLLNPERISVDGYVQTCKHKTMICGRKFSIKAFPFLTQDNETMTCAETALFNLIQYYGQKYSEYRVLMPSEILEIIEKATYERVLPSIGVDDLSMAKVLQAAHLHPRFYSYKEYRDTFETIFHAYVESGLPLILGLPSHAIICIGHGTVDFQCKKHELDAIVDEVTIEEEQFFYVNTANLVDQYIFMDDNKIPYYSSSINELTEHYYNAIQENIDEYSDEGDEYLEEETEYLEEAEYLEGVEVHYDDDSLHYMKTKYISALVPLSRRIFLDAERALSIFEEYFLKNPDFINEVSCAYDDMEWGKKKENPIVWRMFLASSNSYKDFKCRTANNYSMFEYYSSQPYPRFIWVLEIGSLSTFAKEEARVEVILDATSSRNSNSWAILSVGYKNHLVYVPYIVQKKAKTVVELLKKTSDTDTAQEEQDSIYKDIDWDILNEDVKKSILTNIFEALYDVSNSFTFDTFPVFRDANLKEI